MSDPFDSMPSSDMEPWKKVALAAIAALALAGIIYVLVRAHRGEKRVKYIFRKPQSLKEKEQQISKDVLPEQNFDTPDQWSMTFWVRINEGVHSTRNFKTLFFFGTSENDAVVRVARDRNTHDIFVALRVRGGESLPATITTEQAFEKYKLNHLDNTAPYAVTKIRGRVNSWSMITIVVDRNVMTITEGNGNSSRATRTAVRIDRGAVAFENLRGEGAFVFGSSAKGMAADADISAVRFHNYALTDKGVEKTFKNGYRGGKILGLFNLPRIRFRSPVSMG